jgi:hypothetical protein
MQGHGAIWNEPTDAPSFSGARKKSAQRTKNSVPTAAEEVIGTREPSRSLRRDQNQANRRQQILVPWCGTAICTRGEQSYRRVPMQ